MIRPSDPLSSQFPVRLILYVTLLIVSIQGKGQLDRPSNAVLSSLFCNDSLESAVRHWYVTFIV